MDLFEAINGRRSVRTYTEEAVTPEELIKVLEAGRKAPSWKNMQCCTYVVVSDRELIRKIGRATKRGPDAYNPGRTAYQNAPYFIVVCADPGKSGSPDGKQCFMSDGALVMQNMMLAAHALGLGTCYMGGFKEEPVKKILNIPEELVIVGMTPLGRPSKQPEERPRNELKDIVFLNSYGENMF